MLLDSSSTAAKGSVSKVRAGWIEVEKFGDGDLELAIGETGYHVLDAFDMWQAGTWSKKDGVGQLPIF